MARPIGDEIDQGFVFLPARGRTIRETSPQSLILRKELVHQTANLCDDLDITTLIATANVVGFADAPALEHQLKGAAMVFYILPVTDILAVAIER